MPARWRKNGELRGSAGTCKSPRAPCRGSSGRSGPASAPPPPWPWPYRRHDTSAGAAERNIYWGMPEVADGESGLPVTSTASSRVRHDVCMDAPRPAGVIRAPCSRDRDGAPEQACHARAGSRAVSAAAAAGGAPAQRRWSACTRCSGRRTAGSADGLVSPDRPAAVSAAQPTGRPAAERDAEDLKIARPE